MCPDLPDPVNGMITFATDTTAEFDFMTTATYSCDSGYALVGMDTVRTCVGEEEWSGTAPTCEG